MTVARSAAEVVADHVTLEVECVDRMYLNVYQPRLQVVEGVVAFLRRHRGHPIASSALLEPISKEFIAGHLPLRVRPGVPIIDFVKGQRKDDQAREFLVHRRKWGTGSDRRRLVTALAGASWFPWFTPPLGFEGC
jgi:hypothetical protein